MQIEEFKLYTSNLDAYTPSEILELEVMTKEELDEYQRLLEIDSGTLSEWEHIRAVITFRKMNKELEESRLNCENDYYRLLIKYAEYKMEELG